MGWSYDSDLLVLTFHYYKAVLNNNGSLQAFLYYKAVLNNYRSLRFACDDSSN